ncbi:NAD-dependent epimerase/dehydratase family protein [Kribbella sp. NBC_01245]|uniref:NAD-dependent epimerase/dehydratase family protein n=1 Tax=Kribbella sp. NBC_01245 TaxID=2903578 RepID=UPI002E28ABA8|nr:NAD-dependent epimerase/dehydratase family protein [Kribbella sp. NBC_01245]
MSYVVVGAGPTGSEVARLLADEGERVRVVSRRGAGPDHPLIERVTADATDAERLAGLAEGATALVNCAMPAYDCWPTDWPPLAAAMLAAAERAGADYVMLGNTYGYGPVDGPMTEDLPMAATTVKGHVRAQMWNDALAAHRAGRVRVIEVRASEYLGAGVVSPYMLMALPQVLAGQPLVYPADLDAPRSWSYTGDVARTLVAAGRFDGEWGRAWHVPSTSTLSTRELTARLVALAGLPMPELIEMPIDELVRLGETDSIVAEFPEMQYLVRQPHILDSRRTEELLDLKPTDLDQVLTEIAGDQSA